MHMWSKPYITRLSSHSFFPSMWICHNGSLLIRPVTQDTQSLWFYMLQWCMFVRVELLKVKNQWSFVLWSSCVCVGAASTTAAALRDEDDKHKRKSLGNVMLKDRDDNNEPNVGKRYVQKTERIFRQYLCTVRQRHAVKPVLSNALKFAVSKSAVKDRLLSLKIK